MYSYCTFKPTCGCNVQDGPSKPYNTVLNGTVRTPCLRHVRMFDEYLETGGSRRHAAMYPLEIILDMSSFAHEHPFNLET
jgi:hypothetical protein